MWKPSFVAAVLCALILAGGVWFSGQLSIVSAQERPGSSLGIIGFVGYVVNDVATDSPAAKAGIRPNDVIVYVDDRPVRSMDSIRDTLALKAPGTVVSVKFVRFDPSFGKYRPFAASVATAKPQAPGQNKWLYRNH